MKKNDLLNYYDQELADIRHLASQFADAHPKIAGRLRLGKNSVEDPHVERLIEAFAFLNARIRHKLDDDFPELTGALLAILYPQLQAPTPAMSIAKFNFNKEKLLTKKAISKNTMLISDATIAEQCTFSTCYPVTLWPLDLIHASLTGMPLIAPLTPFSATAMSVLKLTLAPTHQAINLAELAIETLRFYINAPTSIAYPLYELILSQTVGVAVLLPGVPEPLLIDASCIKPVGFTKQHGMLPYDERTLLGYRLIAEFFLIPEKFLFFDIGGLEAIAKKPSIDKASCFDIFIYLKSTPLAQNIAAEYLQLGCTPIVNLFPCNAEPIYIKHTQTEYPLTPDVHKPTDSTEIYAIQEVMAINDEGQERYYQPFYAPQYAAVPQAASYWHAVRKPTWQAGNYQPYKTDVYLVFADNDFNLTQQQQWMINTKILCTNCNLPQRLPYGGGEPVLLLQEVDEQLCEIQCLMPFTSSYSPNLGDEDAWKLISHLSLNHLSLTDEQQGIEALRQILKLYLINSTQSNNVIIDGLLSLQTNRINHRWLGSSALCQGTEIKLIIDETKFNATSIYLFGSVLNHFIGLYSSINSFTQLVIATTKQQEIYRWLPRAGEHALL